MTARQKLPQDSPQAAALNYPEIYQRADGEARQVYWHDAGHRDGSLQLRTSLAKSWDGLLSQTEAWLDLIGKNDAPAFKREQTRDAVRMAIARRAGEPTDSVPVQDRLIATEVGRYISLISRLGELPPLWHYSEKITLLLQACEELGIRGDFHPVMQRGAIGEDGQTTGPAVIVVKPDEAKRFDDLVAHLRQAMKTAAFRKRLARREAQAKHNQQSGTEYFHALLNHVTSKLLTVRVDLLYDVGYLESLAHEDRLAEKAYLDDERARWKAALGDNDEITDQGYAEQTKLTIQAHEHLVSEQKKRASARIERVLADRQRFINNLRKNKMLSAHLVGFIWKLETGEIRGLHYHFVFFFDGHKTQNDAYLGFELGRYWQEVITQGHGRFYNCNAHEDDYDYLGIGQIEHWDQQKRQYFLQYVLRYMTKKEQYLKVKLSKRSKTFDRGQMPACRETKRGRPRKAPVA